MYFVRFPLFFSPSRGPVMKNDIDTDHSRSEEREHEEEREYARLDRHDGQKSGHAHQHTERNQGQHETLTDCGSLTRGFQDQLLSSITGRGSLFISRIACIAVNCTLTLVAHFFVLKHTAFPFEFVVCRHPTGHSMRIHLVARISSSQVAIH